MTLVLQFSSFPLVWTVAIFAASAGVVFIAGTRLSYLADAIGDRSGIGRAFMGLIFLAGITSLPEFVTTIYAAWKGSAVLALNNIFGGIVMQTAIIGIADAFVLHAAITAFPRKQTPILEGILLILLMSSVLTVISIGDVAAFGFIGVGATTLAAGYILTILLLRRFDRRHNWQPIELPNISVGEEQSRKPNSFRSKTTRQLLMQSTAASLVVVICGTLLVETADAIAVLTPMDHSFVGVTLLAAATSLPELGTTIAAVRMGAYTMAISNIFGSNLIMVMMVFPADLAFRQGAILNFADDAARLALMMGVLVTAIYLVGLLVKKKRRILGIGLDSMLVLGVYIFSLYALFLVSQ
jgi:cation:H+ antiporter